MSAVGSILAKGRAHGAALAGATLAGLGARPWLLALILAAASMSATLWWFYPVFYDSDDLGFMRIAAGTWSGTRDYHLVFTHVGIGFALTVLYGWTREVNWYSAYLYAVHLFALSTMFYVLLRRHVSARNLMFCAFTVSLVWLQPLLALQFTTTAVWGAFAAVALLCASVERSAVRPVGIVVAVALGAIASMVRFEGFLLGTLLATPLGLLQLARTRSRALMVSGVALLLVVGALRAADRAVYLLDPEWRAFLEYNEVRSRIHDSPIWAIDSATKPVLRDAGWSVNDARLFRSWFFPDAELYSRERISIAAKGMASQNARTVEEAWQKLKKHLGPVDPWPLILHLMLGLYLFRGRRGSVVGLTFMSVAVSSGIAFWLAKAAKIEDHVWIPLYWAIPMSVLAWTALQPGRLFVDDDMSVRESSLTLAAVLAFSLAFGGAIDDQVDRYSHKAERNETVWKRRKAALSELIQASSGAGTGDAKPHVYVVLGPHFRNASAPALDSLEGEHDAPILNGGWATHSPLWRDALEHYGLGDLPMDLVDREGVLLISTSHNAKRLAAWLKAHRDVEVTMKPRAGLRALSKSGKARVYQLARLSRDDGGEKPSQKEE